jgi:hypothetical protein
VVENLEKIKHLEWAIRSRSDNQLCSLKLLKLFYAHEALWKTKKLSRAAQDLTSVSFSLWRAAFLAEKSGKRADVFDRGKAFLEQVIEDNSIGYAVDKKSRDWTFNYYTRNARSSLQTLNKYWPKEVPKYQGKTRNAVERWEYCESLLDQAVVGFESYLTTLKVKAKKAPRAKPAGPSAHQKRKKVRAMTLAARAVQPKET